MHSDTPRAETESSKEESWSRHHVGALVGNEGVLHVGDHTSGAIGRAHAPNVIKAVAVAARMRVLNI